MFGWAGCDFGLRSIFGAKTDELKFRSLNRSPKNQIGIMFEVRGMVKTRSIQNEERIEPREKRLKNKVKELCGRTSGGVNVHGRQLVKERAGVRRCSRCTAAHVRLRKTQNMAIFIIFWVLYKA